MPSIYDWALGQIEFIEVGDAAAWRLIEEEDITSDQLTLLLTIGCY